jgi:hypothetical protein
MSDKIKYNELHVCMGLNTCAAKGRSMDNECAGTGTCATNSHPCHTLNDCKGQGGCGLFGTTPEFCHPGENGCKYQGSCGTPILASRFISQGPNIGRSVWQLARKLFEERMNSEDQKVGPPPAGPYGPTNEYVNQINQTQPSTDNSSCGNAGSRACSYAADKWVRKAAAKERVLDFGISSANLMNHSTEEAQKNGEDDSTMHNCPSCEG